MHELGLCESIVDAVVRRAGDRPVAKVRVRVGALHRVEPDAFAHSFAIAAAGTVAGDAATDLVVLPAVVECRRCGVRNETVDALALCPACGAADVLVTGGNDLVLESIEYRPERP